MDYEDEQGICSPALVQDDGNSQNIFQVILTNSGLQLIPVEIFSFLGYEDLANCRLVCKAAKHLIEGQRFWYTSLLKNIVNKTKTFWGFGEISPTYKIGSEMSILEAFPWWRKYVNYITLHANFIQLKLVIELLQKYFCSKTNGQDEAPLVWMLEEEQTSHSLILLEFFLDSPMNFMDDFHDTEDPGHHQNPLEITCSLSHLDHAKLIVKYAKKQSIQISELNYCGENALHTACMYAGMDSVKFVLEHKDEIGLDVNLCQLYGTPLHSLIQTSMECKQARKNDERKEILSFLLEKRDEYGINPNLRNEEGLTPIELASQYNMLEILEIFRNHGFEIE